VQAAREAARRTQCVNNLKQIGLAVQNFHDIRQECVPSWLTTDTSPTGICNPAHFAAWTVLLLPFMEQQNAWDLVDVRVALNNNNGTTANSHFTFRSTSIPTYFCPSRRSPPALVSDNFCSVGDYASVTYGEANGTANPIVTATVNRGQPRTWDGAMVAARAFNTATTPNTAIINGMAPGTLGPGDFRSMTNFASVLDGLSNTTFVGEKAVHKDRLGIRNSANTHQDGTYYHANNVVNSVTAPGEIAYFTRRLAQNSNGAPGTDPIIPRRPTQDNPDNRFGSWHPGVSNFMLGDGSVRTVNNATSPSTLRRFATRNDRLPFDIP
jgi:hypothetical protein